MKAIYPISLAVLTATSLFSQTPARLEFEVASIRPFNTGDQEKVALGFHIDGSHVRIAGFSLRDMVVRAYNLKPAQVTGPDWILTDRFDLNATLPAGSSTSDISGMLQTLLADRFKLKFHREKKDF